MIDDRVNLILVVAVDANSLSEVLDKAKDEKIPVIAYDRLIMNTDAISYYVSFDNYTVGTLQARYVVEALGLNENKGPFNIEFTAGDPGDNNAAFFYNGARDFLKTYIDSGKINVISGQDEFAKVVTDSWNTEKAEKRFKNIIKSYYSDGERLDAVICSNDSTAYGITNAIGSEYNGDNKVIITGQDADEKNLKNIVDGKQSMTVYKDLNNEAVAAFDLSDAILQGQDIDESLISKSQWDFDCSYDEYSYDNGTGFIPSFLLKPVAVTKENMKEVLIDPGYYTLDAEGYPHPAE